MDDDLERLRLEVAELRAQRDVARRIMTFARCMDARDWVKLRTVMVDDAVAEFGRGPEVGADRIVESIREFLDHCGPTQHLLGNITVDVDIERGTAQSSAYVSDMHLGAGDRSDLTFSTLGEYVDRWVRNGDEWFLVERRKESRAVIGSFDVFRRD